MGIQTSDNLNTAQITILVEGECDVIILRQIFSLKNSVLRRAIRSGTIVLQKTGGTGNLSYRLASSRDTIIKSHVIYDDAGRKSIQKALDKKEIKNSDYNLIKLPKLLDSEVEDLIKPSIYKNTFIDEFGVDITQPAFNVKRLQKKKWSDRMKLGFEHSGKLWTDDVANSAKLALAKSLQVNNLPKKATIDHILSDDAIEIISEIEKALLRKLA